MDNYDAVIRVIDVLGELDIPFTLVGSLSSNYYGIERSTKDAGFVIRLDDDRIDEVFEALGDAYVARPADVVRGRHGDAAIHR